MLVRQFQKTQDQQSSDVTGTLNGAPPRGPATKPCHPRARFQAHRGKVRECHQQVQSTWQTSGSVPAILQARLAPVGVQACRAERNLGIDSTPGKRVCRTCLLKDHGCQSERLLTADPRWPLRQRLALIARASVAAANHSGVSVTGLVETLQQSRWRKAVNLAQLCFSAHARIVGHMDAARHDGQIHEVPSRRAKKTTHGQKLEDDPWQVTDKYNEQLGRRPSSLGGQPSSFRVQVGARRHAAIFDSGSCRLCNKRRFGRRAKCCELTAGQGAEGALCVGKALGLPSFFSGRCPVYRRTQHGQRVSVCCCFTNMNARRLRLEIHQTMWVKTGGEWCLRL